MAPLRNVESPEHPRCPDGEPELRIPRRHPEEQRAVEPDRSGRDAATEPDRRPAVGTRRRLTAARVGATVDLAHDLDALLHGSRQRQAVQQDIVLPIAACRVAEDSQADVADDPDRSRRFPDQAGPVEVGRIEPQPALIAGIGQARREAQAERRSARCFRENLTLVPITRSSTS